MNIQAFFREMHNPSSWRLNTGLLPEPYPGFRCDVARIIETNSPCDKQTSRLRTESSEQFPKDLFLGMALAGIGTKSDSSANSLPPRFALYASPCLSRQIWMRDLRREHTALDATRRKSVPDRFLRRKSGLLQQANQLHLLRQESIVSMRANHLAVVCIHSGRADGLRKLPNRFGRKQPV
jgi:hypothetical protein